MDETTTDADLQDAQAQDAQPVEQPAEAVQTTDSEPQQPNEPEATDAPADADNADDMSTYLASKGFDLSTPEGQAKLAKSYREAEAALSRKSQEASQLKKSLVDAPITVDTDNELTKQLAEEVVTMKRQSQIDKFVNEVHLNADQETKLAEFIMDTPNMADLINGGYLTLNQAYQLSGVGSVDPSAIKKQGGQEALQTLANKQQAVAPKGGASSHGSSAESLEERLADVKF